LTKFFGAGFTKISVVVLDYSHHRHVFTVAATPQRHRQAGNLEVPPALSFPAFVEYGQAKRFAGKYKSQSAQKMAASRKKRTWRTLYVHAPFFARAALAGRGCRGPAGILLSSSSSRT
jgi:hypothetical protein